jgi:hypothetical protein
MAGGAQGSSTLPILPKAETYFLDLERAFPFLEIVPEALFSGTIFRRAFSRASCAAFAHSWMR